MGCPLVERATDRQCQAFCVATIVSSVAAAATKNRRNRRAPWSYIFKLANWPLFHFNVACVGVLMLLFERKRMLRHAFYARAASFFSVVVCLHSGGFLCIIKSCRAPNTFFPQSKAGNPRGGGSTLSANSSCKKLEILDLWKIFTRNNANIFLGRCKNEGKSYRNVIG